MEDNPDDEPDGVIDELIADDTVVEMEDTVLNPLYPLYEVNSSIDEDLEVFPDPHFAEIPAAESTLVADAEVGVGDDSSVTSSEFQDALEEVPVVSGFQSVGEVNAEESTSLSSSVGLDDATQEYFMPDVGWKSDVSTLCQPSTSRTAPDVLSSDAPSSSGLAPVPSNSVLVQDDSLSEYEDVDILNFRRAEGKRPSRKAPRTTYEKLGKPSTSRLSFMDSAAKDSSEKRRRKADKEKDPNERRSKRK